MSNYASSKGELALRGNFFIWCSRALGPLVITLVLRVSSPLGGPYLIGAHRPKTFWFNQLQSYPRNEEVTKAFGSLSCTPLLAAVQDNMAEIELFVNHCYGQTDVLSVNEARFHIFTSSVSGNFRE